MNGIAIVVVIVVAISAGLIAFAAGLARFAVSRCARRLPLPLSLRMEEEWLAELSAIPNRPGKLVFGLALLLTRRKAFVNPGDEPGVMHDRPGTILGSWKAMLFLPTAAFALAAFGLSYLLPVQYASESVILIRPQNLPESVVPDPYADTSTDDRIKNFSAVVYSRTSLARLVREFENFLPFRRDSMDTRIQKLRQNIQIARKDLDSSAAGFEVRYVGTDPRTVQIITQRLTDLVLERDLENRTERVNGTVEFLQAELDKTAAILTEFSDRHRRSDVREDEVYRLEHEMLQGRYRSIYSKLEDAKLRLSMETKQKGTQFLILDAPNIGIRVGPNRPAITGIGALIGLALGGTAMVGTRRKRRRVLA